MCIIKKTADHQLLVSMKSLNNIASAKKNSNSSVAESGGYLISYERVELLSFRSVSQLDIKKNVVSNKSSKTDKKYHKLTINAQLRK